MAQVRNPINPNTTIDLGLTLEKINPNYGYIDNSGLFEAQGILSLSHAYKIVDEPNAKMTKLTSRTERDAMAVEGSREKFITMSGVTTKLTGGVHVEDLIGVITDTIDYQSESVQQAVVNELTRLSNVGAANMEYLLLTTTQGQTKDPKDGAVAIDGFANTGTAKSTLTINAAPTADIISSLTALSNKVAELNGYNGNVGLIEVVVGEGAFNAIVNHPDLNTMYQLAYQGRGAEALRQPMLNGQRNVPVSTQYGFRREFVYGNLLFVTYPQKFYRWNGDAVDAVANMKGWTIVHGVSNLYKVKYTPAPYFNTYNSAGRKWYARSTGIVDDTHIDMTLESHLIPFMTRPEMAIDITVTTA